MSKFENSYQAFFQLIEEDTVLLKTKLDQLMDKTDPLYGQTLELVDAHIKQQNETLITPLINRNASQLLDDEKIEQMDGQQLGVYKLERKLGQGGMSVVYLAERNDGEIEQTVAIKIIKPSILSLVGDDFLNREAQHLAKLNHPNIATIFNIERTTDGLPYIVMEYVDGIPVDVYCETNKLDLKERLKLFQILCKAVLAAHTETIIHADIKPSNVLVDKSGILKLMDFGIARNSRLEDQEKNLNAVSKSFASPEHLEGRTLSTVSDIYSLGKLLEWLIKGVSTKELVRFCEYLTVTDTKDRCQSVEIIYKGIQNWIMMKPMEDMQYSSMQKLTKFAKRNKFLLFVSTLILGLIISFSASLYISNVALEKEVQKYNSTSSFLINLIKSVNPEYSQKKDIKVSDLIDTGLKDVYKEDLIDEVRLQLLFNLVRAYKGLGDYEKYISESKKALSFIENSQHPNKRFLYLFKLNVGVAYEDLGSFKNALSFYRSALIDASNDESKSNIYHQLGNVLLELGSYNESREMLMKSISFLSAENKDYEIDMSITHNSIGISYSREKKYQNALDSYNRSLEFSIKVNGPDHTMSLSRRVHIAQQYYFLEKCDSALEIFSEVEYKYKNIFKDDDPNYLSLFNSFGKAYGCVNEFEMAKKYFEKSILVAQKGWGDSSYFMAIVQGNYGALLLEFDEFAEAEKKLNFSHEILIDTLDASHDRVVFIESLLEKLKLKRNK